jgi:hypothetical protein
VKADGGPECTTSRRRAIGEITAVIATGAVYLIFENVLRLKLPFVVACVAGWCAYVGWRAARTRGVWREWGFRIDTLAGSALACSAFVAAAAAAILAWRAWRGWLPLPPSTLALFLVYPVWGLMQQYFIQSLVAGNLQRLGAPRGVIIPVSAVLFGLAHAPDVPLMALCAGAGLAWTPIYLRFPNLVPISLTHAWLGTLTYLLVLERNPWREMNLPG